jgi:predicted metal-binding transcription factor (methanogenesis marker protein 9)
MVVEIKINPKLLRDVPGWKNAPVPACYGGDYRSLTFCCHPGFSLTFGYKCLREKLLMEIELSEEKFIEIKDQFSKEQGWDAPTVCFRSLSYCCMRRGGCPADRDNVLRSLYPRDNFDDTLKEYFKRKRLLAIRLLKAANRQDLVKPFIEFEEENCSD